MSDLRERIYQRTGFSNVELDAVIAVVGPLVEQLRQAEVSRDAYRDERDATQRERDQLLTERSAWEQRLSDVQEEHRKHAESWDRTRERLTRERAELRWLHAEAVWRRDQFRANEVENAELANDIFMAAGSKLASAVTLPESWVGNLWNTLATHIDDLDNLNDANEAIKLLIESWRPATAATAAPAEPFGVQLMREGMERSRAERRRQCRWWSDGDRQCCEWNVSDSDYCERHTALRIAAFGSRFARWESYGSDGPDVDPSPSTAGVSGTGTEAHDAQ